MPSQHKKSTSNPRIQDQPHCSFLRLPGELRNEIYRLVLTDHVQHNPNQNAPTYSKLGTLVLKSDRSSRLELRTFKTPSFSQTCRQIQLECLSYLFLHFKFTYTLEITPRGGFHVCQSKPTSHLANLPLIRGLILKDVLFQFRVPNDRGPFDPYHGHLLRAVSSDWFRVLGSEMDFFIPNDLPNPKELRAAISHGRMGELERVVKVAEGISLGGTGRAAKLAVRGLSGVFWVERICYGVMYFARRNALRMERMGLAAGTWWEGVRWGWRGGRKGGRIVDLPTPRS